MDSIHHSSNHSDEEEEKSTKSLPKAPQLPKTYIFRDEVDHAGEGVSKSRIWLQEPTEESLKHMKTKQPAFRYFYI